MVFPSNINSKINNTDTIFNHNAYDNKGNLFVLVDGTEVNEEELMTLCLFVLNTTLKKIIKIIDPARMMYNEIPKIDTQLIEILEIKYILNLKHIDHRQIKKVSQKYFKSIFQIYKSQY